MRTVRFFRFRHRGSGRFARERVRVHSDTIGVRLSLVSRYPPTEFDYVLEESKSCAIAHGPIEWRVHAIRKVGECQSCGEAFDWLADIDLAHDAALREHDDLPGEVDLAHEEARSQRCVKCGSEEGVLTFMQGDRLVALCPDCHRAAERARIKVICRVCEGPGTMPEVGRRYSIPELNFLVLLCRGCAHDIALWMLERGVEVATYRCHHCGGPVTEDDLIESTFHLSGHIVRCAACRSADGGQR